MSDFFDNGYFSNDYFIDGYFGEDEEEGGIGIVHHYRQEWERIFNDDDDVMMLMIHFFKVIG